MSRACHGRFKGASVIRDGRQRNVGQHTKSAIGCGSRRFLQLRPRCMKRVQRYIYLSLQNPLRCFVQIQQQPRGWRASQVVDSIEGVASKQISRNSVIVGIATHRNNVGAVQRDTRPIRQGFTEGCGNARLQKQKGVASVVVETHFCAHRTRKHNFWVGRRRHGAGDGG